MDLTFKDYIDKDRVQNIKTVNSSCVYMEDLQFSWFDCSILCFVYWASYAASSHSKCMEFHWVKKEFTFNDLPAIDNTGIDMPLSVGNYMH